MKRIVIFSVILVCVVAILSGCGGKKTEEFVGIWYGYKVSTPSGDIVFSDYESLVKMELTAEFASDGTYELHYYVAGKEGEAYPQTGNYQVEGERILLPEQEGYGEIVNSELVLYFSEGQIKQYFMSDK